MTSAPSARPDNRVITVGKDFSPSPGGRFAAHGPKSGEEFRRAFLVPALQTSDHVTVYLDGTAGYAGSFLEEAFGGLIREHDFTADQLRRKLTIAANNSRYEIYRKMAENYVSEAAAALKKSA